MSGAPLAMACGMVTMRSWEQPPGANPYSKPVDNELPASRTIYPTMRRRATRAARSPPHFQVERWEKEKRGRREEEQKSGLSYLFI
jgi:hypothetical protein